MNKHDVMSAREAQIIIDNDDKIIEKNSEKAGAAHANLLMDAGLPPRRALEVVGDGGSRWDRGYRAAVMARVNGAVAVA